MTGAERVAIDVEAVTDQPAPPDAFLSVRDLRVQFPTEDGIVKAVDGINLDLARGQTLGIVGESGSGKSVTSQAILGLHKGTAAQVTGEIWLDGQDLVRASEADMRKLRGDEMSMIFQDPLSSMHPFYTSRRPDHRGLPGAQPRGQEGRARGDRRDARPGRHPESGQAGTATTRTSSPAACGSAR